MRTLMKFKSAFTCALLAINATFVVHAKTPQMVNIPAGSFMMGACKVSATAGRENEKRAFVGLAPNSINCGASDNDASDNETPIHQVSISAFKLGKTEVTLAEFKVFIASSGRTDLVTYDFMKHNNRGDNAPVVNVSWNDANYYIDWLNQNYGGGFRLPSEAEWEYACRGNKTTKYCGSDNAGTVAWYDDNSDNQQRAVAQKQANSFGLYDMSGNVWEWTADCWHDNYNGAPADGSAWINSCAYESRVLRGGSFYLNTGHLRASDRISHDPDKRTIVYGFRVAQD
ncbi:MAG: formylglycine-generating enzyme family protein [Acinetobacter johnsonii]